jgi:hypothetical protein
VLLVFRRLSALLISSLFIFFFSFFFLARRSGPALAHSSLF